MASCGARSYMCPFLSFCRPGVPAGAGRLPHAKLALRYFGIDSGGTSRQQPETVQKDTPASTHGQKLTASPRLTLKIPVGHSL
jgi:hypothetical protein